jgi:20S proteasome subunit alpha 6
MPFDPHTHTPLPQIASYDQTGPHLYQTDPSGNYYEYMAQAIGARAQSGKTYLEKHFKEFDGLGVDDLIKHALKALSGTTGERSSGMDMNESVDGSVGCWGRVGRIRFSIVSASLKPFPPAGDKELDKENASVAVVGKDHPLQIIEGEALQKYLDAVELEGNANEPEAMEVASEGEAMSTS